VIKDKFGQFIFDEDDISDIIMKGNSISDSTFLVKGINDSNVVESLEKYIEPNVSIEEFDENNQSNWYMPPEYKDMDIAEYILSLCDSDEELQRCGQELIMYQERNLFNLLKFMKYLVDTMESNSIIWGVGRGSSVSSFVLFKLKVHKIDSMYYNLDVGEFLR
jgi:DNA polymerase III alpha subunit